MNDLYFFNGRDITMNVLIQIRDVVNIIHEKKNIDFFEALGEFYKSNTSKVLKNTGNGLWAESAQYIADCFFENRF